VSNRFEDLYQEYKILHEKRNQLKTRLSFFLSARSYCIRMSQDYSFIPNVGKETLKKEDKGNNFLQRVLEDIEKRKSKTYK